jgi:hypothetical protein
MKKAKAFKKKVPVNLKVMRLSDIKFDKNNLPSAEEFAEIVKKCELKIEEIMSKLELDINKLHRPMTI